MYTSKTIERFFGPAWGVQANKTTHLVADKFKPRNLMSLLFDER